MAHSTSSSVPTNELFRLEKMSVGSPSHDYRFGLEGHVYFQEIAEKIESPSPLGVHYDDYLLCLKHEAGDFDDIPEDLQMKIKDFAENTLIPDVLHYLGTKHPVYRKYSVYQVELHGFEYGSGELRGFITNEERYDLWTLQGILELPFPQCSKLRGKRIVGSAIRMCKAIGKPEHAHTLNQIVEGCFTPHEDQDPKDTARAFFSLHVEPSTGGIQCNCCQNVE